MAVGKMGRLPAQYREADKEPEDDHSMNTGMVESAKHISITTKRVPPVGLYAGTRPARGDDGGTTVTIDGRQIYVIEMGLSPPWDLLELEIFMHELSHLYSDADFDKMYNMLETMAGDNQHLAAILKDIFNILEDERSEAWYYQLIDTANMHFALLKRQMDLDRRILSWDRFPGSSEAQLARFLIEDKETQLGWVKGAEFTKPDENTIMVTHGKQWARLRLSKSKRYARLKMSDGRMNKYYPRMRDGEVWVLKQPPSVEWATPRNALWGVRMAVTEKKTELLNEIRECWPTYTDSMIKAITDVKCLGPEGAWQIMSSELDWMIKWAKMFAIDAKHIELTETKFAHDREAIEARRSDLRKRRDELEAEVKKRNDDIQQRSQLTADEQAKIDASVKRLITIMEKLAAKTPSSEAEKEAIEAAKKGLASGELQKKAKEESMTWYKSQSSKKSDEVVDGLEKEIAGLNTQLDALNDEHKRLDKEERDIVDQENELENYCKTKGHSREWSGGEKGCCVIKEQQKDDDDDDDDDDGDDNKPPGWTRISINKFIKAARDGKELPSFITKAVAGIQKYNVESNK